MSLCIYVRFHFLYTVPGRRLLPLLPLRLPPSTRSCRTPLITNLSTDAPPLTSTLIPPRSHPQISAVSWPVQAPSRPPGPLVPSCHHSHPPISFPPSLPHRPTFPASRHGAESEKIGTNLLISSFWPWRMHSAIQTRFLRGRKSPSE